MYYTKDDLMLIEYKRKTYWGIGTGLALMVLGVILGGALNENLAKIGFVGYIIVIWGCCQYAMSKGYKWTVGLLGLGFLLGLLILMFLPDKHK